jgi:hypothetical protein
MKSDSITVVFFDGKYADNLMILQVSEKIAINVTNLSYTDSWEIFVPEIKAKLFQLQKWEIVSKKECELQLSIQMNNTEDQITQDDTQSVLL